MNLLEFKEKINIPFLNANINEMLKYNIPFPVELIFLLDNEDIQDSIHKIYFIKAKEYQTWYDAMKRTDQWEDDYYEYCYRKTLEYITKLPKFKELIK